MGKCSCFDPSPFVAMLQLRMSGGPPEFATPWKSSTAPTPLGWGSVPLGTTRPPCVYCSDPVSGTGGGPQLIPKLATINTPRVLEIQRIFRSSTRSESRYEGDGNTAT